MIATPDVPATLDVVEPAWADDATGRRGGSDAALLECAARAALDPDRRGRAGVVGPSSGVRAAGAFGLGVVARAARPARFPIARSTGDARRAPFVRLWGTADRTLARAGARVEWHAMRGPGPHDVAPARRADLVTTRTERDRDAWAAVGLATPTLEPPDFAPLARDHRARRERWRDELGLGDQRLLLVLADHPSMIDARQFGFLLGFLAIAGHEVAGVVPRGASNAPLAWRHIKGLFGPCRLFETDLPTSAVLPACDLALLPSGEAGTGAERVLSAWAEALGVPTVHWGQREPGKLRHTPASARAVIDALGGSRV